jgi:hypothetical protein
MTQLTINYAAHDRVRELINRLKHSAESISLAFTEWKEPHVKGPGLYFAVISDREYGQYADAMGANQWPTHQCESVFEEASFTDACRTAAFDRDGGVVVAVDGVVEPQMVRFRDLSSEPPGTESAEEIEYEDWMGSRHMSALETSTRPQVVATITLSEENGRVSVFCDGVVNTAKREKLREE